LSTIFALLTTQAETKEASIDGVKYYIQKDKRVLPQGSPASPAISNIIAHRLDNRLKGIAKRYGFSYTRYADDLTFSCTQENSKNTGALLHYVKKIVTSEDFTVHPEKVHVMPKSRQQKVTGIVVNKKINIDRNKLRQFRALLHNISIHGWKDQQWGKAMNIANSIDGFILFVKMVNPQKAELFKEQWTQIIQKHGWPSPLKKGIHSEVLNSKKENNVASNDASSTNTENNDFWLN
jgi:retron-type reverse transcriptase